MKDEKLKSFVELHVCNHKDCAERGSKELTDKLKKWAKEKHGKEIRVYRSGCLGQCSDGIAMSLYPERRMFTEVKLKDYKEIKEGLEEALKKSKN
jgi:sirohydrochlorin cobaltochelatase